MAISDPIKLKGPGYFSLPGMKDARASKGIGLPDFSCVVFTGNDEESNNIEITVPIPNAALNRLIEDLKRLVSSS